MTEPLMIEGFGALPQVAAANDNASRLADGGVGMAGLRQIAKEREERAQRERLRRKRQAWNGEGVAYSVPTLAPQPGAPWWWPAYEPRVGEVCVNNGETCVWDGEDFAPQPATRHGDFMQTYTGRQFWPMDPRADEVCIEDIAHSLSLQCRYAGHCLGFYSVAEHSVHIAWWLFKHYGAEAALCGLLHDAAETYLVDVPRPVKPFLPGYKEAEARVMAAISEHFGLPLELPAAVKEADDRILADELVNLAPMDWHATHDDPLGVRLRYWHPALAEEKFMATFEALRDATEVRAA